MIKIYGIELLLAKMYDILRETSNIDLSLGFGNSDCNNKSIHSQAL